MMQRMKGTLRPGRKAGVLALAVLLLTCVLMAGAVSASGEEIQFNQSSFKGTTYPIESGGIYVLNDTATGNITISASGDVILKAINGATLNGGIQITKAQNVTIKDMHIKSTFISGSGSSARNLAIDLRDSIKLCLENNTIEFAASDVEKGSSVISTGQSLSDGSAIIDNTISGVTAHVLNTAGVEAGGTLIVQGNTVTMSPNEDIGYDGTEDQGKGRALLKLFHQSGPASKVKYIVTDNVVKIQPGNSYNATVVRVDEDTPKPEMITVTMYNNTYKENPASPYLYGGSIYGYRLGELSITVSEADGPRILVPGLNQTGVVWSDGAGVENQELELNESGSYKLMGDFTTTGSGIQITADGVTLDGSEGKITTTGKLDGYILKVAVANTGSAAGVTLQNLDITGTEPSGTGEYGGITVFAGKNKASVPVTLKGSTVDMSQVTTESGMNPAVYFVNASGSEITDNEITAGNTKADGSSTPRAIVVAGGSDISISKNEITMGAAEEGVVSHAIQFQGPPTGVTISGNEITATSEDSLNRAVSLTTTGAEGESYVITGNTLTGNTFNAAVHVIIPSTIKEGASFNLEIDGNTFTNTDNGVMIADYGTNGITLTGKINTDDFPGKTAETIISAEEGVVTLSDTFEWTHDPEPQPPTPVPPSYSSSSGNMNNAYRVLFNDGSTTLSVQTDLSSGDKLTKPETPVKDGYTFAGWYKDSACTNPWDFETGIPGDMTLYAKWTAAGSSGETEATATPTATATAVTTPQPTKTQTAAATTSAPEATTAAGVSPTLTQAPAPVAGALFGLLAAGVLLRRRFQ